MGLGLTGMKIHHLLLDLTCKLTTLLVLTITSRASMIQHLNTEFIAKHNKKYKFYLIYFYIIGEDKPLFAVKTLNEYINV